MQLQLTIILKQKVGVWFEDAALMSFCWGLKVLTMRMSHKEPSEKSGIWIHTPSAAPRTALFFCFPS